MYDRLEITMVDRIKDLKPDIEMLPEFMASVRMTMIPSVGYFVVASKKDARYDLFLEQAYLQH